MSRVHALSSLAIVSFCCALGFAFNSTRLAKACEFNNCINGCHMYTSMFTTLGGCEWAVPGQHWDALLKHVAPTWPGGAWNSGGDEIVKLEFEDCCKKCLGNVAPGANQQTTDMFDEEGWHNEPEHVCEHH